jgi:hypothetical protein
MVQREHIEGQIREVLARETTAGAVSQQLFHPTGLFGRLASTEAERRMVAQSALFQEAQGRLSDLQRQEAEAFAQAMARSQPPIPKNSLLVQLLDAAPV